MSSRVAVLLFVGLAFMGGAIPAHARGPIPVSAIGALVAHGHFADAKKAVREAIAEAEDRILARMRRNEEQTDPTVRLLGDELWESFKTVEKSILKAIDKAAQTKGAEQRTFEEAMRTLNETLAQLERQQDRFLLVCGRVGEHRASPRELSRESARVTSRESGFSHPDEDRLPPPIRAHSSAAILREELYARTNSGSLAPRVQKVVGNRVIYRTGGLYEFDAIGSGLGFPYKVQVTLDGRPVEEEFQSVEAHVRRIALPVDRLNDRFDDMRSVTIPLTFTSEELKRVETKIVLLPRFPVEYELIAVTGEGDRIRCRRNTPGRDMIDGEDVRVRKPVGEERGGGGAEMRSRLRLGILLELAKVRFCYGTNFVELPENTVSYTLSLRSYDGTTTTLTPTHTQSGSIRAVREKGRLRVDVRPPFED